MAWGNNPYDRGESPLAGLLSGFMDTYTSETDRQAKLAQMEAEEDYKRQQIAQSMAQEQRLIREEQSKQAEAERMAGFRNQISAPVVTNEPARQIPMSGLLGGESLNIAPMESRMPPSATLMQERAASLYPQIDPLGFGKMAVENSFKPVKSTTDLFVEKVMADPTKYDDKTLAIASKLSGVDIGAFRKEEKEPGYKQRDYQKGDQHVYEESYDGGKTWKPLSNAPRYKPDNGLSMDKSNRTLSVSLRKEFNNLPEIKESNTIMPKIISMRSALNEAKTTNNYVAADQALITLYNKLTDPSSVVRESEYARTPENLKLINRLGGKVEKVMKGGAGLTMDDRESIMKMAENMKKGFEEVRGRRVREYSGYAVEYGLNPKSVINEDYREPPPSKPMTALPAASEHKGRTVIGSDGIKRKSDGTKWNIEVK